MAKIISVFCHKGGVGKTSFLHNIGVKLATDKGKKVLFIDADSQMNLSSAIFGKSDSISYGNAKTEKEFDKIEDEQLKIAEEWREFCDKNLSFVEYFNSFVNGEEAGKKLFKHPKYDNIDLLRGDITISNSEIEWTDIILGSRVSNAAIKDKKPYLFQKSIKDLRQKYDYIFIDTPPSTSIITGICIMSSDYFIIPVFPNFFSLQAINNLRDIISHWRGMFEKHLVSGNLLGMTIDAKFLGIVMQKSRRFSRDAKKQNQYTKATTYWTDKINDDLKDFYNTYLNRNSITKEQFSKIFSESLPLIIDNICEFPNDLSSRAEKKGIPITKLTEKEAPNLKKPENQHRKAFDSFTESYEYIANCFEKL